MSITFEGLTPFCIIGHDTSSTGPSDAPIVMFGQKGSINSGFQLSIVGDTQPESFDGFPLFMSQNTAKSTSFSRLFIKGVAPIQGTRQGVWNPLYMFAGDTQCEIMGMFIAADNVPAINTSNTIAIYGNNNKSINVSIPMFITGSVFNGAMNLFIRGNDSGGTSKILRFFIRADTPNKAGNCPMFINNNYQSVSDSNTELFIRGDGQNPDFLPYGDSLGIHIERGPNAGITLYLENKALKFSIPFHIIGAPLTSSSTRLFVKGLGGSINDNVSFITKGNVFQENHSTSTLVIPGVVGFEPEVAYLYINGFKY